MDLYIVLIGFTHQLQEPLVFVAYQQIPKKSTTTSFHLPVLSLTIWGYWDSYIETMSQILHLQDGEIVWGPGWEA